MRRGSNPRKVDQWSKRLLRFRYANATVAQFCQDEGVSVSSFYHWKRKLRKRLPAAKDAKSRKSTATDPTNDRLAFQTVHITSPENHASPPIPALTVCLSGGIQVQVADSLPAIETVMRELVNAEKTRQEANAC